MPGVLSAAAFTPLRGSAYRRLPAAAAVGCWHESEGVMMLTLLAKCRFLR